MQINKQTYHVYKSRDRAFYVSFLNNYLNKKTQFSINNNVYKRCDRAFYIHIPNYCFYVFKKTIHQRLL
jgi:hypothetical protein